MFHCPHSFYSFRENRRIKMNNDQSDCPKCYRKFHNKGSLAHHLETCFEDDQKDPLALDVKIEQNQIEIEGVTSVEVGPGKEEAVIEILDTEEPLESHKPSNPKCSTQAPPRLRAPRKLGRLDCYYCHLAATDRISLTKHLVGQHWDLVRDRQGGGRKDNRLYYSSIQDDRVLQPGGNKLFRNIGGHLPPPNRKILPKPNIKPYHWQARIRDQDFQKAVTSGTVSPSVRFSNSFFGKTPDRKIVPKSSKNVTNSPPVRLCNSFFGKTPDRKILPKSSKNVTISPSVRFSNSFFSKQKDSAPRWTGPKRRIPTYDLTRQSVAERQRQPAVSRVNPGSSRIPNTNHLSLNKVGPNSELDKLVKKFANSNSNLQITKVSK